MEVHDTVVKHSVVRDTILVTETRPAEVRTVVRWRVDTVERQAEPDTLLQTAFNGDGWRFVCSSRDSVRLDSALVERVEVRDTVTIREGLVSAREQRRLDRLARRRERRDRKWRFGVGFAFGVGIVRK